MQQEIASESPELSIDILGVNELGHESGNSLVIDGRDLPWLQDIDDDGNGSSDVWTAWDVTFRDVIITDSNNVQVAVYNLTTNDLGNTDNYATLKQLLVDAASATTDPGVELSEIDDQTVQAGSPLHIPLNGLDPAGGQLTFTVESSDPLVSAEVLSGNRSLRMQVDDFGTMTFELFESRAPRATDRMIELAESDHFTDTIFHRVIDNFVIQGGDPTGTGSGGSTLGDFDDQFHVGLQHNRTGLLSMAKTTDDTNDSQFFITEGPARHLDFNHSIFGLLTEGEGVRAAISDVAVNGELPLTPVVLHEVDIFDDLENGVLMLSAAEGATGVSTITVTVSDTLGNQVTRSFDATVVVDTDPNSNGNPFLDDIADVRMEADSVATFQLTAQDSDGDTDFEFLGESELAARLQASQMPTLPSGLDYTVDSSTGDVSITASEGLVGEHLVRVGVRKLGTLGSDSTIDSQLVSITLGVLTVSANDHSSGSQAGDGTPDTISIARTSGTEYDVSVNGEVVRTIDESLVHAIDLVGSTDDDIFVIDCSNGPPTMPGGVVITGGSQQTVDGDSLELNNGSFSTVTHHFDSTSAGTITLESNAPIQYSGLEPFADNLLTADRVFEFGNGDDQITIGDDDDNANGISTISSVASSEMVDFQMVPGGRITVRTGAGHDEVTAFELDPSIASNLTIAGEAGDDTLDAAAMTDPVTLTGGSGDDSLIGGSSDDAINGQAGDDVVLGQDGDDTLLGGSGRDRLDGGNGSDRLRAQGYSGDTLVGSGGSDLLSGGDGTDHVTAQGDADVTLTDSQLTVGTDTHQLADDIERAVLTGGAGDNTIDAAAFTGNATLSGGDGGDTLTGSAGVTTLQESLDQDLTLTNSQLVGNDTDSLVNIDRAKLVGGAADNQFDASDFTGPVTLRGSAGNDTMIGGAEDDLIFGGTGDDRIEAGAGNDDVQAGSGHDTIDGGDGDDSIRAAAGNDSVVGASGNDTLNGANGRDTVEGGTGDDAISGLNGSDLLSGGTGNDTLVAGTGNDTIAGGDDDDLLLAGDGNDSVSGDNGLDTLAGNAGNDSFDEPTEVDELFVFYQGWIDRV